MRHLTFYLLPVIIGKEKEENVTQIHRASAAVLEVVLGSCWFLCFHTAWDYDVKVPETEMSNGL